MKTKQKKYWWVDMVLFAGFLLAFFLSFTGLELHQWIGVFGGLLALYHLLLHSDWVDAVSQRLFSNLSANVMLKYVVDGLMLVGFMLIILTGLIISTWLDFSLSNYHAWLTIHILASIFTLLALMVKLVLHWRWISRTTRTIVLPPVSSPHGSLQLQPVPVEKRALDRRDFLKVMGVAGGASLLALLSATHSLAALQDTESISTVQPSSSDAAAASSSQWAIPQASEPSISSSGSCTIQCGRRCSYPGHCRRYTDADNDNYCDLGQCS